ncbi:hypothetical protein [Nannocystis pusilla]
MHVLLHPSSFKLLQEFDWPGNFRQFEMTLSNLLTFTLVDLVDRPERIEPEDLGEAGRPDIIPILPRTVSDLLRPMTAPTASEAPVEEVAADGAELARLAIVVRPGDSLNAVSCAVERQYLEHLYERCLGDLGKMGEILLNDAGAGRKIQLRMNQLGIKLRRLKRRADG